MLTNGNPTWTINGTVSGVNYLYRVFYLNGDSLYTTTYDSVSFVFYTASLT